MAEPVEGQVVVHRDGAAGGRYIVLEILRRHDETDWLRAAIMNSQTQQLFEQHTWVRPHPFEDPTDKEAALFMQWKLTPEVYRD